MHQLPPSIEATNFVQMIRKEGSVKGTWIIDSTLIIPPALLPPLPDGTAEGDRKNLHLQSKEGSVYGDVYIKPTSYEVLSTMKRPSKISIYGMSKEGKVELKIHEIQSDIQAGAKRLPLSIKVYAKEGDVRIYVPRSFCGPFRVTTRSSSKSCFVLSPGIRAQLSTFSENMKVRQGFIGRFDGPSDMGGSLDLTDWDGDVLEAEISESSSSVKLYFDDEEERKSHEFCVFRKLSCLFKNSG
ncbi:hypothetical protein BJ165DRAFT_1490093 [Panaeolus papilionaceus]|nr:hypothetical protein BJ165DRAFT_1490093 [Panaeolus papilionaceus]